MRFFLSILLATSVIPAMAAQQPDKAPKPDKSVVEGPTEARLQPSIDRGVRFLLNVQNQDGSWGSARRTKRLNIYAPVPGAHHAFRTAVTSLCLMALIQLQMDQADVQQTIDRGEQWLLSNLPHLRRAGPVALYNVWGHAYGLQALAALDHRHADNAAKRKEIAALVRSQYDMLDRFESVDGGWGYYDFRVGAKKPATDSTSFLTAAVLVALHDAKQTGIEPPMKLVRRAVDSLHRQQKPDFSYLYGEYLKYRPMRGINRPGGSLGRSQACNLALRYWNDPKITDQVLVTWLNRLVDRNGWLSIGRKRPIPHESWFQVAGYFFYFGHYYAALCIDQLPPDQRAPLQARLADLIVKLQEKDGSWWDFPLYDYHQPYGTAFALMTLHHCQKH